MMSMPRIITSAAVAMGLFGLGACSGPGLSTLEPALALGDTEEAPVGTHKIGKPYKVGGKWYTPSHDNDYNEVGMASWYGPGFHGKSTANGERFDQNALTAAHTTLPLPSFVRVTNLDNKKSVVVRVNDRGPFSRNRIIDLSKGAAKKLDFIRHGHTKVRVEYLGPAPLDGDDEHTLAAAKKFGKGKSIQVASADTAKKPAKTSRGFFGFGKANASEAKTSDAPVNVRLAAATPRTEEQKKDEMYRPRSSGLPGVREEISQPAPVRLAGVPGGNRAPARRRATVSADEPISPSSPAYAALDPSGPISAPIKVTEEEYAQAYTMPTPTTRAIDAANAMAPPAEPLPEPDAPDSSRFSGAHDLFAATESGGLFRPTSE